MGTLAQILIKMYSASHVYRLMLNSKELKHQVLIVILAEAL